MSSLTGAAEMPPEPRDEGRPDTLPAQRRRGAIGPEDARQADKQQVYAVAVCFAFLYALSYFATELVAAPLLWYYPTEQRWAFGAHPAPGLMMGWYGKVLLSFAIAGLGAGLLALGLRIGRRELGPALQALLDLAAMSMVIFVLYYIARSLAYRVL